MSATKKSNMDGDSILIEYLQYLEDTEMKTKESLQNPKETECYELGYLNAIGDCEEKLKLLMIQNEQ